MLINLKSAEKEPTLKTVRIWTEEATMALQDCFDLTDWKIFAQRSNLEARTFVVLSHISFCTDKLTMKTQRQSKCSWTRNHGWTARCIPYLEQRMMPSRQDNSRLIKRHAIPCMKSAKYGYKNRFKKHLDNNNTGQMRHGNRETH